MSAWIVSKGHIDCLVQASIAERLTAPHEANETGRMLWQECFNSVVYRYPNDGDGERPGPRDFRDADVDDYEFRGVEAPLDDAIVVWQIHCYDYQSCEHPEWETSDARELVLKLEAVIDARHAAEGDSWHYNAPSTQGWHPWGIDSIEQAVVGAVNA